MAKKYITCGVDVGNFDTKSQDTTVPNGYSTHVKLPPMAKSYLYYDGKYYCPSEKRFHYLEDKTKNERALILTLMGISNQILYRINRKKNAPFTKEEIQNEISKVDKILLGVGLPISHTSKDSKENLIKYYERYLKNGIQYVYNDFQFEYKLEFCCCFPQNYAATCTSNTDAVISKYKKFYTVDIGGGTMDVLPFLNGGPDVAGCFTENVGVLYMYSFISQSIKKDYNLMLENSDIEDIIRNEETIIPQHIIEEVKNLVKSWVDERIVDALVQRGINFETAYLVFFGGGSSLLKYYLEKNIILKNIHFLKNPVRANAKGYAILVEKMYEESRG